VGSDHLRGDHPDRRHRRGDLPGCVCRPWRADDHAAALPDVHAVRLESHARAHHNAETDRHPETDRERQGDPDCLTDPITHRRAGANGDAHDLQSGARELPDAAATADTAPDPDTNPDRGGDSPDPDSQADPYAGADDPTELDAAPHRHPNADPLTGPDAPARLRTRKEAGCRSRA
jgi:hypothetical protein